MDDNEVDTTMQEEIAEKPVSLKELVELLAKLTLVQAEGTKVKAIKSFKTTQKELSSKKSKFEEMLDQEVKSHRASEEDVTEIKKKYSGILDEIYAIHEEGVRISTEIRTQYQEMEQQETINITDCKNARAEKQTQIKRTKKEIKEIEASEEYKFYEKEIAGLRKRLDTASKDYNTELINQESEKIKILIEKSEMLFGDKKAKLSSLIQETEQLGQKILLSKQNLRDSRKGIKEETAKIKESSKTAVNAIDIAEQNKDKQLAVVKKKNAIAKLLSAFAIMVGGKKRFAREVLAPLRAKFEKIKQEKIPELKADVQARIDVGIIKLEQLEQKIKQASIETKDTIVQGAKTVGDIGITAAKTVGKAGVTAAKTVGNAGVTAAKAIGSAGVAVVTAPAVGIYMLGAAIGKSVVEIVNAGRERKNSLIAKMAGKIQDKLENKLQQISQGKQVIADMDQK